MPNVRVSYIPWTWDAPAGYWRSVAQSHNRFFVESFIDELSHESNEDPLASGRDSYTNTHGILTFCRKLLHRPIGENPWHQGAAVA